jgi:hypothetical protein
MHVAASLMRDSGITVIVCIADNTDLPPLLAAADAAGIPRRRSNLTSPAPSSAVLTSPGPRSSSV